MNETFNPKDAIQAQQEYCKQKGYPHFAPYDGRCYRCHNQIYQQIVWPDGHTSGISVEHAASGLVTGCNHCHYSFVE